MVKNRQVSDKAPIRVFLSDDDADKQFAQLTYNKSAEIALCDGFVVSRFFFQDNEVGKEKAYRIKHLIDDVIQKLEGKQDI